MHNFNRLIRIPAALVCSALLPWAALADSYPQTPVQPATQPVPQQLLPPEQLSNLVAPVALYPDPLLGQLLAASTYPLELVEAQQWLQQNGNLQGQALVEAARRQDWDPSVQVLVAFPDVVGLLNRDIRWTTDLGNAFLAQQADVMNAIQTLRFQAKDNGRLATTPQQVVSTDVQNGQDAVRIEPANPQVIYPPVYNPAYVWGPPAWGTYPPVSNYPSAYANYGYGGGNGYGFGSGINIAGIFSNLLNFASWGWSLGWFTHSLSLVSLFFNILGFHGFGGGGYGGAGYAGVAAGGLTVWAHNPVHRLGVPYPRGFVASRGNGAIAAARTGPSRFVASTSGSGAQASRILDSSGGRSWQGFGREATRPAAAVPQRTTSGIQGSAFQSPQNRSYGSSAYQTPARNTAPASSYRASSTPQASSPRYTAQASAPKYSEPKYSTPKYSAPKFSAPKAPKAPHFSAPKNSGGHSGKSSHKH